MVPPREEDDERACVTDRLAPKVGKKPARARLSAACAPRYCAAALAIVWFEMRTFDSSSSSSGSRKISHHAPRGRSSPGAASFQVEVSWKAAGVATFGFT